MDFSGFFEHLLWIIFLLFCLSFNYKKTHWLNLITVGGLCAIMWFPYPEEIEPRHLVAITSLALLVYTVLHLRFHLNRYFLGEWGNHFLQFLRRPSFKHHHLSVLDSIQLITHFLIIKLFITMVFILPLAYLSIHLLNIDWQSAKNIPKEVSLAAIGEFIWMAIWEELMFRAAFRKATLSFFLHLLIVLFTFGISIYSFSFVLLAACGWAVLNVKWNHYYVKYRFAVVYGSAILFGLLHHNGNYGWFDVFGYQSQIFGGLCYIWLRVRYGLTHSIFAHSGYNLLVFSLYE